MPRVLLSATLAAGLAVTPAAPRGGAPLGAGATGQEYCIGPWYAVGTACPRIANPYERSPTAGDQTN